MSDASEHYADPAKAVGELHPDDAARLTSLGTAGSDPVPIVPMRRQIVAELDAVLRAAAADSDNDDLIAELDRLGSIVTQALR